MNKLAVAFYWHQHQPYYKDGSGIYQMPWVRFHGTKDYLDLLLYLKEYPEIKQNFNLVPSLLVQIDDYVTNGTRDLVWLLSEKDASQLTHEEKKYVLNNFFMANYPTMIEPYPRYNELYHKYKAESRYLSEDELVRRFDDQEYRDLQFWYNLTWIGIKSREREVIKKLIEKGENFREEEKEGLFKEILDILAQIVPLHAELKKKGQIDLTTTPFYHPILPLLCDNYIAKESTPDIDLPSIRFKHPEDAEVQVKKALDYFKNTFDFKPDGMWPAEGSVSEEAVSIISKYGLPYIATDEGILQHSLQGHLHYLDMYKPYRFKSNGNSVYIFFRDHALSDAIGFVYSSRPAENAVNDFIHRLEQIRAKLIDRFGEEYLEKQIVSIILDGENCWEFYPNDGKDFLQLLYKRLSDHPTLKTVTYSQFLAEHADGAQDLPKLHPGSWINHNFKIWIGAEEDNKSWEVLAQTREFLEKEQATGFYKEETLRQAWEEIYIAEGSDWNWWYGEEHSSAMDMEFDRLYRSHLLKVYELLGFDPPGELLQTIKQQHFVAFENIQPKNFISPKIDGQWSHFYEWHGAALYHCGKSQLQSTMHQVTKIMDKIYLGFDLTNIYLRIDFLQKPSLVTEIILNILSPEKLTLVFSPLKELGEVFRTSDDKIEKEVLTKDVKLKDIFEIAFPYKKLGLDYGQKIGFQILVKEKGHVLEQFPNITLLELILPDESFEMKEWII
ncbi:MAG: glycoside hydrolase family 57 protein [Calditrichia bacterium]